jgi:hypothetical protein
MKSFLKFIGISALVLGLLSIAFGVLVMFNVMTQPDISLSVNDFDVELSQLHAGHFVIGVFSVVVVGAVLLVVLPLSLLLGLALPLLILAAGLAIGVLALVGVGALALSPVLILLLPLIWLARRGRRKPAPH